MKTGKKVFVTVFTEAENQHLTKDVGMISYLMHTMYQFDSYLATYRNGEYPYLETEVKGLKLDFIQNYTGSRFLNLVFYIFSRAGRIDVLHLFGFSLKNLVLLLLFKILNRKDAKSYLKLDANEKMFKTKYNGWKKKLISYLVTFVDVISCERKDITKYLNSELIFGKKVHYLPNGFIEYQRAERPYYSKKNQFITVGRLYDPVKAVPVLLEGFAKYFTKNPESTWSFFLVGPAEADLLSYYENLKLRYRNIENKIIFMGEITDKKKLADIYEESKFFVSASLSESFGFVFLEAMLHRNFILSTPLPSAHEITNSGMYQSVFKKNNADDLSEAINVCVQMSHLEETTAKAKDYVYKNFYWKTIIEKLNNYLYK